MKKIYMTPATNIMLVELQQIMAGSFNLNEDGGTGNPSEEGAEGDALSRRGSSWDDEY